MPLTMPASPGFLSCPFKLETNTQRFESPLTKNVQRVLLPGARWSCTFNLPAMNRQQMGEWQAFLMQLEGGVNTFYGFDPDGRTPRGAAAANPGTPLVNGANQTGSSLVIDAAPASVTGWLLPGDYVTVENQMVMVTAPVSTNGSGQATIPFKPALRSSPADNAPVTVQNATCLMILADDGQTAWQGRSNRIGFYEPLSFAAMEVF
jgi:hypothetical protein